MPNPYKISSLVVIAALSLGAATLMPPRPEDPGPSDAPVLGALYAAPPERVETHVLRSGQTLNMLLAQARIIGQEMADLELSLRQHVNPRSLRVDSEVTVRRWSRDDQPRAVEVRLDPDRTVRLVREDMGWNSQLLITPIRVDTLFAAGTIGNGRNTLYETMVRDESSRLAPQDRIRLVSELASIYDTKLDFAREIQLGDSYRLVYQREGRPDGSARSMKIIAAEITSRGHAYPAIWFEGTDGVRGYYDPDGRPLAHGFSRHPISVIRITSAFNPNRYHPILGQYRAHTGTDFGAPTGTPVMSVANGTVTFAGTNGGYGRMIEIRHFNGYTTRYAHLSAFANGIRVGAKVTQKQVIGKVGATGLATAPHLHYELRINGRPVDGAKVRLPDAPPMPAAQKQKFTVLAQERSALLERAIRAPQYADRSAGHAAGDRAIDET